MCKVSIRFVSEIQAKPEKVWDILADIEAWPKWQGTDFTKLVTPAPVKEGSKFKAKLGGVKWNLTVTKADRPRSIIWSGNWLGLNAVHGWEFEERDGKTIASTWETISGWLMILSYFTVRRSLPATDKKWLADLKSRAESP